MYFVQVFLRMGIDDTMKRIVDIAVLLHDAIATLIDDLSTEEIDVFVSVRCSTRCICLIDP